MATGWTFCPINRVMTMDPNTINFDIGTVVAAYPAENQTDPIHWNQTRITTSAGAMRLRFTFGTPSDATDSDFLVNTFGLVNHNLDGAVITLSNGSTTTWSNSLAVSSPMTLQAGSSNPNMLLKFSEATATYWFLDITGATTTVAIGQIVWGYSFDVGYPHGGEQYDPIPLHEPVMTSGGYEIPTKLIDPAVTKVLTFRDPEKLGSTVIYDKSRHITNTYPTYVTMERAFNNLRNLNLGGSTYTGSGGAGGAVPMLYHEGDVNGISAIGRPAHYGYVHPRFIKHDLRPNKATIVMSIRDANPRGTDIAPKDSRQFSSSGLAVTSTGTVGLSTIYTPA